MLYYLVVYCEDDDDVDDCDDDDNDDGHEDDDETNQLTRTSPKRFPEYAILSGAHNPPDIIYQRY